MAMMIIEKKRKRKESVSGVSHCIYYDRGKHSGIAGATDRDMDAGRGGEDVLKINFSVGVSIYNEKVTCFC